MASSRLHPLTKSISGAASKLPGTQHAPCIGLKKQLHLPIAGDESSFPLPMSAALNRAPTMRLLGSGKAYRQDLLGMIAGVDLFTDLAGQEQETLSQHLQAYEAEPGCAIFREGEPGHYMCFLVSGRIKTYKESDTERRAEVSSENRGRSIGEMALIDGEPRSATCIATESSVLLVLTQAGFQRLSEDRPALALKLLLRVTKLMSRRLRLTSGRLVDYLEA